ncbi:hypothetical protein PAAG_11621 [Paracoccidioides lutzii Pb01]|uniref:PiggyBac transposable element-derived protein domain-containing protein n=1 Tax=Paracoccidioides lutzii (strain ATCC MYA-826 / Pb01) TaxID=502779 RepID=A0A0A2V2D1_PARBA|nr:hypothetical protein PAAG_11621 [Paracoccidioides lutzii Pb01]KGQ01638.1 hypothetical protein PAAG_11621 [Paracoccidioides lutzii Pb01]
MTMMLYPSYAKYLMPEKDGVMFEYHKILLQTPNESDDSHADAELIDEEFSPEHLIPDTFCVHRFHGSTNIPTTTAEYKLSHKLSVEKSPNKAEKLRYNAEQLTGSVLIQKHHVITLTTIHSLDTFIECTRKLPGALSMNAKIVWKIFEGQPQKRLKIPAIIDDYSHNMNGVDLANQYRAAYTTHRITYRTCVSIFYWLFDSAAVNAYRLQYIYKKQQGVPKKDLPSHINFHERLYQHLFEFTPKIHDYLPPQRLNPDLNHQRIALPKQSVCAWCQYKRKLGQQQNKQTPRSYSGCSACQNMPLYLKTQCWDEFHEISQSTVRILN